MKQALLIFALATAAVLSLNLASYSWAGWPQDGCRNLDCYCETIRNGFVLQPIVAYSNLGFLLVGLLILGRATNRPREIYFQVYGFAVILIGAGSFFYHASLTRAGEWADLMGTYLFLSFLALYNLWRLRPFGGPAFVASYVAINSVLGLQMIVARELQQIIFGILAAGALTFEALAQIRRRLRVQFRFLIGGLACFAVGVFIWIFDGRGFLACTPQSLLQWHAVWHLLMAVTTGLLYLYYRSENAAQ